MLSAAEGLTVTASTRRAFLLAATLAAAVLAACSRRHEAAGAPRPPDVLILLADDLGWADVGWHARDARPEQGPNARGFDPFCGHLSGWVDYFPHEHDGILDWQRDGVTVREEGYSTRLMAQEAIRILGERDRSRPLLLYVAFNAPHP